MALAITLLTACGGDSEMMPAGAADGPPPTLMLTGHGVIKFRAVGRQWVALTEHPQPLVDTTRPDRRLLVAADGTQQPATLEPPEGWSLIDFALHPSGKITLVLATNSALRLQRRGPMGELLAESDLTDEQAPLDPFIGDVSTIANPGSLVPKSTRDAVRLAPLGEDLVLVMRTGRNAVVAQRLTFPGAGMWVRSWRTLVEPGVPIDWVRLTGGSFDPFTSLDNQWHVVLDVDAQGRTAIAMNLGHTELPEGHRQYFHEPLDPALFNGVLVTLLGPDGGRLGATALDTQVLSELQVVRWVGGKVLLAGRLLTARRDDGGGWDAYVAQLTPGGGAQLQPLDFDRGDIIFDVAGLADGRIALAGSTGYTQNPDGASVSEDVQPLLAVLPGVGAAAQRLMLPPGPRQNQVRTLAPWLQHFLVGGVQNGPGTHSADADPSLLTWDGFLRMQPM